MGPLAWHQSASRLALWLCACCVVGPGAAAAEPVGLAFRDAGQGWFEFHTGLLSGRLKYDGKFQGLYPLVDAAGGETLTNPPGLFSLYRVFSTNHRYGDAARDWPVTARLRGDGAVEVRWDPAAEHPLAITGVYQWVAPDTLDLRLAVTPQIAMPKFELFVSNYFTTGFEAFVYRRMAADGPPRLVSIDRGPQSPPGAYVMFPRDAACRELIRDGRWTFKPSPVDWALEDGLAAPLILRRDPRLKLAAALMARPDDCFAVSCPWNPTDPQQRIYRSSYLSLFGRDVAAGETVHAACRLVLARDLSDEQVVERYRAYLAEPRK